MMLHRFIGAYGNGWAPTFRGRVNHSFGQAQGRPFGQAQGRPRRSRWRGVAPYPLLRIFFLGLSLSLLAGCAYFNTFYNATTYYQQGVTIMEEAGNRESDRLPSQANTAFGSAIEKSLKVIENFPNSRYVDDALFIVGRSHFYRQEYGLAERYLGQLLNEYPWIDYGDEIRIWLGKVHAEMGLYDLMEEDLAPILAQEDPPPGLLTEVYILQGELAVRQQDLPAAISAFEQGAERAVGPAQKSSLYYRLYTLAFEAEDYATALNYLGRFARTTPNESERIQARLTRVQLLQQMDDIDGAYREIRNMVALSEFASIIPGLQLEIGKIERRNGNTAEALDHFIALFEEFQGSSEASAAAFHAGDISLTELHDIDRANGYYSRVRNNSIHYQPAREKMQQIATLKRLDSQISDLRKQLELRATHGSPAAGDSAVTDIDRAQVRKELAYANYRLGEIRLFELHDEAASLEIMANIVSNFEETEVASQAAYVLYYHTQDRPDQEAFWRAVLLEKYPLSPYALALDDGASMTGNPRLDSLTVLADRAVEGDPRLALRLFRTIQEQFGTAQASFSIAYLYDEYLGQLDNAIAAYEEHLALHPSGNYREKAQQRLKVLQEIKADLPIGFQQAPK